MEIVAYILIGLITLIMGACAVTLLLYLTLCLRKKEKQLVSYGRRMTNA